MAYKFQLGPAVMSGSLTQEGGAIIHDHSDVEKGKITIEGFVSGSGDLHSGGDLKVAGTVALDGVVDTAMVAGDDLLFRDSDGLIKRETAADVRDLYFSAVSGDATIAAGGALTIAANAVEGSMINSNAAGAGLGYASNALAVNVDDSSIEINADTLRLKAGGVVDAMLNDDVATGLAGDGLGASSGVLAVQVSGAVVLDSDKVGLSGSFAGLGLSYAGGVDSISSIALDFSELTDEAIASGDRFAFRDATDDGMHADTVDDLAALFAGTGLAAASAVLSLDLNELTAAAVDVANDSIAIIDADDSNTTKKESIADLVAGMAGSGLSASGGQLSIQSNVVTAVGDDNATLAEGMNAGTATFTADRTWTLDASPSVGDIVYVKAPGNLGGFSLIVSKDGGTSHTIDGEDSVTLESNGAAISLMYVAANNWVIF